MTCSIPLLLLQIMAAAILQHCEYPGACKYIPGLSLDLHLYEKTLHTRWNCAAVMHITGVLVRACSTEFGAKLVKASRKLCELIYHCIRGSMVLLEASLIITLPVFPSLKM